MLTPKHRALFHAAYSATLLRSAPQEPKNEPTDGSKDDEGHEVPPSGDKPHD